MRKSKIVVVLLLLAIAASAGANLLSNPGFENGDTGDLGSITDWNH
jgi:hypothetical protein